MNLNVTAEKVYGLIAHYFSEWSWWKWIMFSPSNQECFKGYWLDNRVHCWHLMPLMATNRVMRDHPDWVKKSSSSKNPLADGLACPRSFASLDRLLVGRICFVIRTTSPTDKFTRSKSISHSNGSWLEATDRPSSRLSHRIKNLVRSIFIGISTSGSFLDRRSSFIFVMIQSMIDRRDLWRLFQM